LEKTPCKEARRFFSISPAGVAARTWLILALISSSTLWLSMVILLMAEVYQKYRFTHLGQARDSPPGEKPSPWLMQTVL
jgi:hypothetical protein